MKRTFEESRREKNRIETRKVRSEIEMTNLQKIFKIYLRERPCENEGKGWFGWDLKRRRLRLSFDLSLNSA